MRTLAAFAVLLVGATGPARAEPAESWAPPRIDLQACGESAPLPWVQKQVRACVGAHAAPVDIAITVQPGKPRARASVKATPALDGPATACIAYYVQEDLPQPSCTGTVALRLLSTPPAAGLVEAAIAADPEAKTCKRLSRATESLVRGVVAGQAQACFARHAPKATATGRYWVYERMVLYQSGAPTLPQAVGSCLELLSLPVHIPDGCRLAVSVRHTPPDAPRPAPLKPVGGAQEDPSAGFELGTDRDQTPPEGPAPPGELTWETHPESSACGEAALPDPLAAATATARACFASYAPRLAAHAEYSVMSGMAGLEEDASSPLPEDLGGCLLDAVFGILKEGPKGCRLRVTMRYAPAP